MKEVKELFTLEFKYAQQPKGWWNVMSSHTDKADAKACKKEYEDTMSDRNYKLRICKWKRA